MAYLYIQNRLSETPLYDDATEDIPEGDLVVQKTGGGAALADYNTADRISGIALHLEAGDHIASHEYDYETGIDKFVYEPSGNKDSDDMFSGEDDRVPVRGRLPGEHLFPRTITDSNADAPSIDKHDIVGVVDASAGNAPSNAAGKIVEEGYSNSGTTFNRSNNNFIALGRAVAADEAFPVSSTDERVWVERTFAME